MFISICDVLQLLVLQDWETLRSTVLSDPTLFRNIASTISACSELNGMTLLHAAVRFNPPLDMVAQMIRLCPQMTAATDCLGRTALHVAAGSNASASLIKLIALACPAACEVQDEEGKTPLHFACDSSCVLFEDHNDDENDASNQPPNHDSIRALLSYSIHAATLEDDEEMTPLEHVIMSDASLKTVKLLQTATSRGIQLKKGSKSFMTAMKSLQSLIALSYSLSFMGRKRNQGKARKAAKARAEEEAKEETGDINQTTDGRQQPLAAQMQHLQIDTAPTSGSGTTKCWHGSEFLEEMKLCIDFVVAFSGAVHDSVKRGHSDSECLTAAHDATMDKFAEAWNDSAKMESAMSYFLYYGTEYIIEGNDGLARKCAACARYFEQYIAAELHQTQAIMHWQKIKEMSIEGDTHTLVKLFRKRIPCACLNKKYDEVKTITKMGICLNPQCNNNSGLVERAKQCIAVDADV
ncbi:hypothetical protein QTG54_015005 [Skeletonema marinoi]|uniref:Uncharacterized protein n=1 Tax=Skeletonema marinoi TaxID=267567 RepID=A0AAD8XVK3_9STRA|nr:hypothetical protein QTG54_015005 [Skeletonema marinoi]